MAQPRPPEGAQKQYNERPLKVFGEQYVEGQIPVGAIGPPDTEGEVRIFLSDTWIVLVLGDWVVTNRYTGVAVEVLSNEEFTERFGGAGAEIV
jgi:hypothetical protein